MPISIIFFLCFCAFTRVRQRKCLTIIESRPLIIIIIKFHVIRLKAPNVTMAAFDIKDMKPISKKMEQKLRNKKLRFVSHCETKR